MLDAHYPSFLDAVNTSPPLMKKKFDGANAKFFGFDCDELVMFELDTVDIIRPLVVLTVDTNRRMKRSEWLTVYKFLRDLFNSVEIDYELQSAMLKIVPKVATLANLAESISKDVTDRSTDYEFRYENIDGDICVCEITKPFTDLPYTVVIREYSKNGLLPLFTAPYVAQSWGVTNLDHAFLYKLWEYLAMDEKFGSLDLEKRLQNEIEACKNGKPEPEVYRADLETVISNWSKKQKRLEEAERSNKFIKI